MYGKRIISADLFKDRVTAHPMPKLSCFTWWSSQKLIHNSLLTRTALTGLGPLNMRHNWHQKKTTRKVTMWLPAITWKITLIKLFLECLSVPPSFYSTVSTFSVKSGSWKGGNQRAMENGGHRSSPACITKSSRGYISFLVSYKGKSSLCSHIPVHCSKWHLFPLEGGQKYHLKQKENQV